MKTLKAMLFVVCLLPAVLLAWMAATGGLGANPIEALAKETGRWALRFLLLTLAITPLRRLLGIPELVRFRRMLGLFAFFYACLHLLNYVVLDLNFRWEQITDDVVDQPFMTLGLTTFLLLLPLAVTSTRGWQHRLARRWTMLHRLVYVAGITATVHFLWAVKADLREPLVYAGLLALLLGYRLHYRLRAARSTSPAVPG
jgi:sulfoxide reductase heme-binding subunit YedZ